MPPVTSPAERAPTAPRPRRAWPRLVALALSAPLILSGCLSLTDPAPSPTTIAVPSADPSAEARQDGTLVVMAPDPVTRLLPPASNPTEALLIDLLYDPLYRLDERLRPVPVVASALPEVTGNGLTWRIPIREGARFHNGQTIRPADVAFSLRLAASPTCPLGRELCEAIGGHMAANPEVRSSAVVVTLDEPYSPFLAEGLAQLPIVSEDVVKRSTSELIGAAERLESDRPDEVVRRIADAQLDDRCITDDPPDGCLLSDHRKELEDILRRARVGLPPRVAFTDETGLFDENAYAGALLDRLFALGQVFGTEAADRQAAALPLLDVSATPLGGGAFRLDRVADDGARFELAANRDRAGGRPGVDKIEVLVERDPAVSATRLLTGEADWVLQVGPEQVRTLDGVPGVRIAERPLPVQRGILFNVRPKRVYFDAAARRAFGLCLDRETLATQLDADRPVARDPYRSASWARPEVPAATRDVATATKTLDAAGWRPGPDGIRVKDGVRLASTIADPPEPRGPPRVRLWRSRAARRVRHRAHRRRARPDRRHDARPAALAERLRHAPVGAAARHGPGHRRRRVRVVAQDDGEEPGRRERRRVHVRARGPSHRRRAHVARRGRPDRCLRGAAGPARRERALLAALVRQRRERGVVPRP